MLKAFLIFNNAVIWAMMVILAQPILKRFGAIKPFISRSFWFIIL
jgi:hypothetical protein